MTKLLERAIAAARELPDEDQDTLAMVVLSLADRLPDEELDEETRAAIREGLEQMRRGEFATDAAVDALWRRVGL